MGFGKFFGNILQAGAQVVALPLDVAKDVLTLGGAVIDEDSATIERLKKVKEELEDAYDELDKE